MTTAAERPVPQADERSQPFFDGMARGELMLQRCRECGTAHWPLREVCQECLGDDLEWVASSGRGTIHSFGVMHRVYHPGFAALVPYSLAVVELEEGPRVNTNIVGVDPDGVRVGDAVTVEFQPAGDAHLPVFRPA